MMKQPHIHVGIMADTRIIIFFDGVYNCNGKQVEGEQLFARTANGIAWQGSTYDTLTFTPEQEEKASFLLQDVTIGIGFHWQRHENQRFRGGVELITEEKKIRVINHVMVEEYLRSVISSEMKATSSLELLKAHAVISRSWLLAQIEKRNAIEATSTPYTSETNTDDERIKWYDREEHENYDVCADDHCQRYQGITRASTAAVNEAVDSTFGQVLYYGNHIADARFSKCCGGVTELFENCWEPYPHPYLTAQIDSNEGTMPDLRIEENAREWILSKPNTFCNTNDKSILSQVLNGYDQETSQFYRWRKEYEQEELSALIRRRSGIDFGTIQELEPIERGTSGRITRLRIVGTKRTIIVGKELEIRRWLSESHLYSSAFVVEKQPFYNQSKFILHGAGWGHGVGLCQMGAAVMGAQGYQYREILAHYFRGTELRNLYSKEENK